MEQNGSARAGSNFLSKEDMSEFLSIKPYLSEKGQTIVDLLAELQRTNGRPDPGAIAKLISLVGGDANAMMPGLNSLASMLGGAGGKMDPAMLMSMMGALTQAAGDGKGGGPKIDPTALMGMLSALNQAKPGQKQLED